MFYLCLLRHLLLCLFSISICMYIVYFQKQQYLCEQEKWGSYTAVGNIPGDRICWNCLFVIWHVVALWCPEPWRHATFCVACSHISCYFHWPSNAQPHCHSWSSGVSGERISLSFLCSVVSFHNVLLLLGVILVTLGLIDFSYIIICYLPLYL